MRKLSIAAVCATALSLSAQGVVSPKGYENRVGNTHDHGPFWFLSTWTYQQIHTDLKGRARTLRQIAFRQGDKNDAIARTVEMDLTIGHSSFANRSRRFADNFVGTPSLVFKRRKVSLPAFKGPPKGGFPAPFTIAFKFDAPWAYSGKRDLCYQIRVYSNSIPWPNISFARYALDFVIVRDWNESRGEALGTGCLATGQQQPMALTGAVRSYHDAAKHTFQWSATRGPKLARATFLIGARRQELFVPQLCTLFRVADVFSGINTVSDREGSFATPTIEIPYDKNLAGARIVAQAYALDNGRHPGLIPVSATNGLETAVPARPPKPVDVVRLVDQGFSATTAAFVNVGWAIIAQFN